MLGAKQPNYIVTADDVDAYLAIEVQPLDNRKRKVLIFNFGFGNCGSLCRLLYCQTCMSFVHCFSVFSLGLHHAFLQVFSVGSVLKSRALE